MERARPRSSIHAYSPRVAGTPCRPASPAAALPDWNRMRLARRQEDAGVLFAATKVAGRALGSASKFSASVHGEDATALTASVSCLHSRSLAPERIDRARRWLRTRCRRPRARGLFCVQRDIRARSPAATESKRWFHLWSATVRIFAKS